MTVRQSTDHGRETLDEHRECMEVVSAIEACLDRPPDREGRWLVELREKLPPLVRALREHFEHEESGYLYRDVPQAFPRFSDRLRVLEAEHRGILESAEKALRRSTALERPELHELRELNARVQLLVATIRRHEAEENEILLHAHWDDVGAGD